MLASDRFTIPGQWLFLSFFAPYLLCFSKFANKRFWKRHLYSEDRNSSVNKQTNLNQTSKINENFKILTKKIITIIKLLDIRKYLLFENKKDLSLIIFLSIILKPFFTKLVFPFHCGIRIMDRYSIIERFFRVHLNDGVICPNQPISRHISEIFFHSESYIILFVIITFMFWYFGRVKIKNPLKSL